MHLSVVCPSGCLSQRGPHCGSTGTEYRSIAARRTAVRRENAGSATSSAYVVSEHRLVNKKLCYRRRTARRAVSGKMFVNCSNKLYNKSTTNRSSGVRGLRLTDL